MYSLHFVLVVVDYFKNELTNKTVKRNGASKIGSPDEECNASFRGINTAHTQECSTLFVSAPFGFVSQLSM
jgi:hypothetical protein